MASAAGYGAGHPPPLTPSQQPASAARPLGTAPVLDTGMAAGPGSPTPHARLPYATQEAFLLLLLHFHTLFMLLAEEIANVLLSATRPGFRCSIKKNKKAPETVASISALQRSRLVQRVLPQQIEIASRGRTAMSQEGRKA